MLAVGAVAASSLGTPSMASLCPTAFAATGVARVRGLVAPPMLHQINTVMRSRADRVMSALGSREIGIGSAAGYHELVQRSHNRFDVPLDEATIAPLWLDQPAPWLR